MTLHVSRQRRDLLHPWPVVSGPVVAGLLLAHATGITRDPGNFVHVSTFRPDSWLRRHLLTTPRHPHWAVISRRTVCVLMISTRCATFDIFRSITRGSLFDSGGVPLNAHRVGCLATVRVCVISVGDR